MALPRWMPISIEFRICQFISEQDKWSAKIAKLEWAGKTLPKKQQEKYNKWKGSLQQELIYHQKKECLVTSRQTSTKDLIMVRLRLSQKPEELALETSDGNKFRLTLLQGVVVVVVEVVVAAVVVEVEVVVLLTLALAKVVVVAAALISCMDTSGRATGCRPTACSRRNKRRFPVQKSPVTVAEKTTDAENTCRTVHLRKKHRRTDAEIPMKLPSQETPITDAKNAMPDCYYRRCCCNYCYMHILDY